MKTILPKLLILFLSIVLFSCLHPVQAEVKSTASQAVLDVGTLEHTKTSSTTMRTSQQQVLQLLSGVKATAPAESRATVTEHVNEQNQEKKVTGREFLTFTTKSGKVFHLIINHDENRENVQLLTEVSEQDLLNMIKENQNNSGLTVTEEKPTKIEESVETPKKAEEPKETSNIGLYFLIGLVMLGVAGVGYYFKVIKPKQEVVPEFEDIEEDDFIQEAKVETLSDEEEIL